MGAQPRVIGRPTMEPDHRMAPETRALSRGSVVRVENGQGTLVCVRSGYVWLTQEREWGDIMLHAGQQFLIARDGCTLVEALRDSEIELMSPDGTRLKRRIHVVHPGNAHVLPMIDTRRGLRGAMAAIGARLMNVWLGLYAPPPRRTSQVV